MGPSQELSGKQQEMISSSGVSTPCAHMVTEYVLVRRAKGLVKVSDESYAAVEMKD